MNKNKVTIYKHNDLIEARYAAMTTNEQLLLLAAIGSVDPRSLTAETPIELTVSAFADLADISARYAYDELRAAALRLYERDLVIDNPDPENPSLTRTRTRWVHSIEYYDGEGRITLYFAPKVLPYLSQLSERFTKYKLRNVAKFSSSYSLRLYELLVQWRCKGSREVDIGWLRSMWGLEDKYKSIRDLKRWVLEPAIRDINEHSNLWVQMGQRKRGRRVVAFQFQFGLKAEAKKPRRPTRKEIEQEAKPGETWEAAEQRLLRERGLA